MSKAHLVSLFRSEVDEPPHRYLLQLRLEEGARRLVEGDFPVTRIALDLGFASSQHFAMAFRKRFGSTPTRWRQEKA